MPQATLYYIHDPMCSWCWGFASAWGKIQDNLPAGVTVDIVLGGLAPDSSEPMPADMQEHIKANWLRIQQVISGVEFNYDFWEKCQPRRSTYPACRAVLAAKAQGEQYESEMIKAIQRAYYLEAKNPSDDDVLIGLADALSLDIERFSSDLNSSETQHRLQYNIDLYHQLSAQTGVSGFPSLAVKVMDKFHAVPRNYNDPHAVITYLHALLRK